MLLFWSLILRSWWKVACGIKSSTCLRRHFYSLLYYSNILRYSHELIYGMTLGMRLVADSGVLGCCWGWVVAGVWGWGWLAHALGLCLGWGWSHYIDCGTMAHVNPQVWCMSWLCWKVASASAEASSSATSDSASSSPALPPHNTLHQHHRKHTAHQSPPTTHPPPTAWLKPAHHSTVPPKLDLMSWGCVILGCGIWDFGLVILVFEI
jgi:hypothetical protein